MTRILFGLVLLTVSPLGAQVVRVGIAGGAITRGGGSFTQSESGWHVLGALQIGSPRSRFAGRVEGMHGEVGNGGSRLTGGSVNLVYRVGAARHSQVYLLGGPGFYQSHLLGHQDFSGHSETQVAYGAGAGVSVGTSPARLFGEVRYFSVANSRFYDPSHFFLVTAGVSFGN
jgi:hypothetical protein